MRSHLLGTFTGTFTGTFARTLAGVLTGSLAGVPTGMLTRTAAGIARAIPSPAGAARSVRFRAGVGPRVAGPDDGMATTEYAIATVAAAGFAGLLVVILRSAEVRGLLTGLVRSALTL
ncbi:MAG TPA: DUF4244 domain-containing protein [Cellulomonadaceae bacterium]|nr:DUF4244 domain-containing protein [Cellulomonadaceae bacterium]